VSDGAALVEEITQRAKVIRRRVEDYVNAHQIPLLHFRNLMSLPYNLPATLAVHVLAVERPDIGFLMQHHDIYWEGPNARDFVTRHRQVSDMMDRNHVPVPARRAPRAHQPLAAAALRARKGLDGTVIPDGFDFGRDVPGIDELAFRGKLEVLAGDPRPVGADGLVVTMPARIAINKAIERTLSATPPSTKNSALFLYFSYIFGGVRQWLDAAAQIRSICVNANVSSALRRLSGTLAYPSAALPVSDVTGPGFLTKEKSRCNSWAGRPCRA
jgi:hypothetical protein